jgi:hypothetical protein
VDVAERIVDDPIAEDTHLGEKLLPARLVAEFREASERPLPASG